MDKKALQLISRFSLPPNALGYCGKDSAPEKFKKCVIEGKCVGVEKELKNFIVLHPYLKTLSKIIKKDLFSYQVAEAYWLGNSQLTKVKHEDYMKLINNFRKQGVPDWLIKEISEKQPKKFIPTHLFQILHIGVGKASGSVPYNLQSINNCMVRWGKVKKISKDVIWVDITSLTRSRRKYNIVKKIRKFPVIPGFIPRLKVGDTVAVHWKQAVKKLNEKEIQKLSHWTKEVLRYIN